MSTVGVALVESSTTTVPVSQANSAPSVEPVPSSTSGSPSVTMYGPPASATGWPPRPNVQSLAAEVSTVSTTLPSGCSTRDWIHGSGAATPDAPVQSGTATAFRNTVTSAASVPAGSRLASSSNSNTNGSSAEAAGASIWIVHPKKLNPSTTSVTPGRSSIRTVPAFGVVTVVSIGSSAVAPSPSVSVVIEDDPVTKAVAPSPVASRIGPPSTIVKPFPAAIRTTPDGAKTRTGVGCEIVPPVPSCPLPL